MIAAKLSVTAKQLFGLMVNVLQSIPKAIRWNATKKMDFLFKFYQYSIF